MTKVPALELVAYREVGEEPSPVVSASPSFGCGVGGHWVKDRNTGPEKGQERQR